MKDGAVELSDEEVELKRWLRELVPDGLSQAALARELRVTRRTVVNLLSETAGFGNGLTMLRFLQLAGAVAESPTESPLVSRLAGLEATVDRTGSATTSSLADLAARLQSVERELKLLARRAKAV